MTGMQEHIEREMYAHIVGQVMFCPVTGKVLDVRTAVVVENADRSKVLAVVSPEAWEQARESVMKVAPDAVIIVNGKVQETPSE